MEINGCELPSNFHGLDPATQLNLIQYLEHLNPIEVKAYNIAKNHLKSSFNVLRSNGYADWLKEKEKEKEK